MTTKDYVKIIDAIVEIPSIKPHTKARVLAQLEEQVFKPNNPNFNEKLYWHYINVRLGERHATYEQPDPN